MVRIKMKATGGPFMWKKLGLPKSIPYDSDDEAWDTTPPATTNTEMSPATEPATGRTDLPAAQTYRRQKKRPRTPPPPSTIAPKANLAGEMLPEATTSSGHGQKRPRPQSPPRLEPEAAMHPTGHKENTAPPDSTSAVPTNTPADLPSAMASDVPSNVPTDAPSNVPRAVPSDAPMDLPSDTLSDMPSNLLSDLPRPAYPDHIVKSLTFNKISERTRLLKVSSLPYHPGIRHSHGL
ncbi:cell surface glycoprotein 1-like [Manihot esculenta]|uniref:cell surface glycoprotein 1-like n=1 Tax=Manihot esculenta TaxID=3983 RepID=UPI001CC33410|nr:cell surface glycoprotein 1-like [Manihot esculenta]